MNVSSLFRITCNTISSIALKTSLMEPFTRTINRNFHYLCNKQNSYNLPNICVNKSSSGLLQTSLPIINLTNGLKMKTVLQRRCRMCIRLWKNGRMYINCKAHPRHNQVQRKKKDYNTWIVTHASQSKVREW